VRDREISIPTGFVAACSGGSKWLMETSLSSVAHLN
jgi:hypothetical protein